jgi:hypothetical protein
VLFADSQVLSAAEAAAAVRAASANARPLLVCDPGRRPPKWVGSEVDVVAPAELAVKRSPGLVIVDVGACETVVEVLRSLAIDRFPDELGLVFDDPASAQRARGATGAGAFVPDERPVVWVAVLHDADVQGLRRLFERVDPVTTLAVVPWPTVNPRRGDDLIVACASLLEAAGAGSGEIVYASDSTPLDLYRSLSALQEQLKATYASSDDPRLVLTPYGRDAHGLATALAAYEHGAELVSLPNPHATATRRVTASAAAAGPRILWTSRAMP